MTQSNDKGPDAPKDVSALIAEAPPTTYIELCAQRCPNGCGKGLPNENWLHEHGCSDGEVFFACTAPSPEQAVADIFSELASAQERIARLESLERFSLRCLAQFPEIGKNNPDLDDKMAQLFQVLMSEYGTAKVAVENLAVSRERIAELEMILLHMKANARFPPCGCGGAAVGNASGDITRTCIRCGAIVLPVSQTKQQD